MVVTVDEIKESIDKNVVRTLSMVIRHDLDDLGHSRGLCANKEREITNLKINYSYPEMLGLEYAVLIVEGDGEFDCCYCLQQESSVIQEYTNMRIVFSFGNLKLKYCGEDGNLYSYYRDISTRFLFSLNWTEQELKKL